MNRLSKSVNLHSRGGMFDHPCFDLKSVPMEFLTLLSNPHCGVFIYSNPCGVSIYLKSGWNILPYFVPPAGGSTTPGSSPAAGAAASAAAGAEIGTAGADSAAAGNAETGRRQASLRGGGRPCAAPARVCAGLAGHQVISRFTDWFFWICVSPFAAIKEV